MSILTLIVAVVFIPILLLKQDNNPSKHSKKALIIYLVFSIILAALAFTPLEDIGYICFFLQVFLVYFALTLSFMNLESVK